MTVRCLLEELRSIENKDAVICIGVTNKGLDAATNICIKDNEFIISNKIEGDFITVRKLADYLLKINVKCVVKINFTGLYNIYSVNMYKSKYIILGSY